jgi:hypothetical protein
MLGFDADVTDAAPTSQKHFSQYVQYKSDKPWNEFSLAIPGAVLHKVGPERYVDLSSGSAGDVTRDAGSLIVATGYNSNGSTVLGHVYFSYTVRLTTPQYSPDEEYDTSSRSISCSTGVTRAAPFGTAPTYTGELDVTADGNTMTFGSPGEYIINLNYNGTVATDVSPTPTYEPENSFKEIDNNMHTTDGSEAMYAFRFKTIEHDATISFDFTASCTTITGLIARIAYFAYSITDAKPRGPFHGPRRISAGGKQLPVEEKTRVMKRDPDVGLPTYEYRSPSPTGSVRSTGSRHESKGRTGGFIGNSRHVSDGNVIVRLDYDELREFVGNAEVLTLGESPDESADELADDLVNAADDDGLVVIDDSVCQLAISALTSNESKHQPDLDHALALMRDRLAITESVVESAH